MSKRFILVDTMNLYHRAKYVTKGDVNMKTGLALHIILSSVKQMWEKFNGSHVVFCLDNKSWRYTFYPKYKATRKVAFANLTPREKEEEEILFEVLYSFIDYLETYTNVTVLRHENIEADDFIARWVDLHPDDDNIIISNDSDFFQLLRNNVKIYNSVGKKNILYTIDGAFDDNGKHIINKKTQKPVEFIDPEWELFKKIMRGDVSDNIMSAYPRVTEKKLKEAFNDRKEKSYIWNNLMLQTWDDIDGNKNVVLDKYNFNKRLIDLRYQPDEIKKEMDKVIIEKVQKERVSNVGIHFLRFCGKHMLENISKYPDQYVNYLSKGYDNKRIQI